MGVTGTVIGMAVGRGAETGTGVATEQWRTAASNAAHRLGTIGSGKSAHADTAQAVSVDTDFTWIACRVAHVTVLLLKDGFCKDKMNLLNDSGNGDVRAVIFFLINLVRTF
ncbi:hypothetical protein FJT64_014993 [Amphibalanus amphitrite]|uniref:Uncharacterized protein n=1 Tax=Amphibalanus amphitrite TaxID=1232801 RepID=A0A6A4XDW1_AMPAM|nr:hypothetical protein FJT64_014993 [Amphibalanus amphitrite]KAF0314551.1 hypothetical protein FJT64_014993 [Amphibalanus amphitrite]